MRAWLRFGLRFGVACCLSSLVAIEPTPVRADGHDGELCNGSPQATHVNTLLDETRPEPGRGFDTPWLPAGADAALPLDAVDGDPQDLRWRVYAVSLDQWGDDQLDTAATLKYLGSRLVEVEEMPHLRIRVDSDMPSFGDFGGRYEFFVLGCNRSNDTWDVQEFFMEESFVSVRWLPVTGAIAAFVGFYALAFAGSGLIWRSQTRQERYPWLPRLAPWYITRSSDGRASISNLQIFWFTLIVLSISAYVLIRSGRLGDFSTDILLLLGIAAGGTATGKVADFAGRRLLRENWLWLKRHGWLKSPHDPGAATFWQLVKDGAGFDVSRFQIVAFSLVVTVVLVVGAASDLADFSIPDTLLQLIGLSQAAYVLGKGIAAPGVKGLDAGLTSLREELLKSKSDEVLRNVMRLEREARISFEATYGYPPEDQPAKSSTAQDLVTSDELRP